MLCLKRRRGDDELDIAVFPFDFIEKVNIEILLSKVTNYIMGNYQFSVLAIWVICIFPDW